MTATKIAFYLNFGIVATVNSQEPFNFDQVRAIQSGLSQSLKNEQTVIDWRAAEDPAAKQQKFNLVMQLIAGSILDRQWNYPDGNPWPLIDWAKVTHRSQLLKYQIKILETTHAIAQSDEELARVCNLLEATVGLGTRAEVWYENWLITLAKSSNNNLKRLVFLTTSNFGEDISKETGITRTVDWNKWEAGFNQSDNLGKALLLVCMTDLASRSEDYAKVASIHIGVFDGTNDELKAVALFAGNKKLGQGVVAKWQNIANNHANPKLKTLAQEAVDLDQ